VWQEQYQQYNTEIKKKKKNKNPGKGYTYERLSVLVLVLASIAACTGDANSRRSRVFPLGTKITDIRAVHSLMFTW